MALSNSAEQRTESPANATPSPEVHQAATEPSSGSLTDVKKPIISNHPTPANQGKKNEKAGEKHANAGGVPDTPDPAELYPGVTTVPNIPDIVVPDISPRGKRGVRRLGGTTIRNLPDGTQVMTLPDGTRVVTRPDGTKRVFGPGERIPRRRVP
jgi:hypothetical protein